MSAELTQVRRRLFDEYGHTIERLVAGSLALGSSLGVQAPSVFVEGREQIDARA